MNIEERLAAYEAWARQAGLRIEREAPWSREAMDTAAAKFGVPLPPAYVDFVSGHGPFRIIDAKGYAWGFIPPAEAIEHIEGFAQACLDEVDLDDCDDDDSQSWIREAAIRRRLYPFLQPDSSVHDFLCFYADKRDGDELLIVSARHDDCELSAWLPDTDEQPGRFEAFLAEHLEIPADDE